VKQPTPDLDLPWFKVFVWDWLNSETIEDFTLEQEAVYMRLLMRQWVAKNGVLPTNVEKLAKYARLESRSRWARVGRPVLETCFERKNGHCWNQKLRDLWEHARAKQDATIRAAKLGADARWNK
jgi:uncharacterized protein YdaU (DUF1376 family)